MGGADEAKDGADLEQLGGAEFFGAFFGPADDEDGKGFF